MTGIEPIPLELLIHTAEISQPSELVAGWGAPAAGSVIIEHVRFEPAIQRQPRRYKGTLFIDAAYSRPFIAPKVDASVTVAGITGTVQNVEALYAFDPETPHHYEVTLA